MTISHYAFSDDSSHVEGRYNSLAMASMLRHNKDQLVEEINNILSQSGITNEFKWNKLKNAKYRLAAEKLVDLIFKNQSKLRIDVIVWDMKDSRHKDIQGRDDSENLVRMYYHLVSTTLSKRWPINSTSWMWHPDSQSSVCWDTLRDCLNTKKHRKIADLFKQNPSFERVDLREIVPSKSHEHPLIQITDLFAGMGAYSFGHNEMYKIWKNQNTQQMTMFDMPEHNFSNSEREKFFIINKFDNMAKERKLQIGLETTGGLKSHNPRAFLNFWLYVPQHDLDKAPKKQEQNV